MAITKNTSNNKPTKRPDWFRRLGIWCSGASWEALQECPTEWNKYAFNGYVILCTALFAFISGSYFLSFVFSDTHWLIPLSFGLFWAFLIFTLDRIIIVSMKKNGGIKQQLWQGGIWRLLLAFFIGIVIATPLELKLFEQEINARVELNEQQRRTELQAETFRRDSIGRANKYASYQSIRDKYNIDQLEADEKATNALYQKLDKQRIDEAEGKAGTGKRGKGPVYREKMESFHIAKTNWIKAHDALQKANKQYNNEISRLTLQADQPADIINTSKVDGVEARVKALYQLSGLHWFITVLFILIECLPVIVKLMMPRGAYDETLERIEKEQIINQRELLSRKHAEINELLIMAEGAAKLNAETKLQVQQDKLNAELQNNKVILDTVAKYQQELALLAIEKWREEQLAKHHSGVAVNTNAEPGTV